MQPAGKGDVQKVKVRSGRTMDYAGGATTASMG